MTKPTADEQAEAQVAYDSRCRMFVETLLALHTITFFPAFEAEMCRCGLPARDCAVLVMARTVGLQPQRRTWTG